MTEEEFDKTYENRLEGARDATYNWELDVSLTKEESKALGKNETVTIILHDKHFQTFKESDFENECRNINDCRYDIFNEDPTEEDVYFCKKNGRK